MLATLMAAAFAFAPALSVGPAEPMPEPADESRIIVKFREEARVRLRPAGLVSLTGSDLEPLRTVLDGFGAPRAQRLFVRDEASIDADIRKAERRSGRDLADLNGYYEIDPGPGNVEALLLELNDLAVVETAYRAPTPAPPPGVGDIPPTTPDFEGLQGYLDPAPGGIDARWAWLQPGGRGAGVLVIDIEYDWTDTHEDLGAIAGQEMCFTPNGVFGDHGTAVMGELAGGHNGYGVSGIVPDASFGMVTQDPVGMSNSVSRAIDCATTLMGPGDVLLMETQSFGPLGLLPSEWNQDVFDSVSIATALGITVVSAAGNGDVDLDDPAHMGLFDINVRDSGAIIVGAGASPGAGQPDRSRLSFSTYGSRVDVQGWGHNVTTAGYGDLFDGGNDPDQEYTDGFSGTSSASPIVAGAAAALQGAQLARGNPPFSPAEVRATLSATGSPQQAGPFPGDIGPRPDLRAALTSLRDLDVTDLEIQDDPPFGNADGWLDPGESATLVLTVGNFGTVQATGVQGQLVTGSDDVAVTGPTAQWPDIAPQASAPSQPAHHRVAAAPGAACDQPLIMLLQLTSDPYTDDAGFGFKIGRESSHPSTDTPLSVPTKTQVPVTSSIVVGDDFTVAGVRVGVTILHGDIGELIVSLRSPDQTMVTLHNLGSSGVENLVTSYPIPTAPSGPGSLSDYVGQSALGTWTLEIIDPVDSAVPPSSFESWSLELSGCTPLACAEPIPGPVDDSLRLSPSGAKDVQFDWDAQAGATSYRVWRSATPAFDTESAVGQTAGTSLLAPAAVASGSVEFFEVRALNVCEWEGP